MSSWYYLVAQLPSLSLDTEVPMPITEEYFLELASRFLDKKSLKTLSELTLEPPKEVSKVSSTLVKKWFDFERTLRFALAEIRARRLKKEVDIQQKECPAFILEIARTACGFESPLEAELYLAKQRMNFLTSITPSDIFCTDSVFAYALKLKLLARLRVFNEEIGMSSYKQIYEKILTNGVA